MNSDIREKRLMVILTNSKLAIRGLSKTEQTIRNSLITPNPFKREKVK